MVILYENTLGSSSGARLDLFSSYNGSLVDFLSTLIVIINLFLHHMHVIFYFKENIATTCAERILSDQHMDH